VSVRARVRMCVYVCVTVRVCVCVCARARALAHVFPISKYERTTAPNGMQLQFTKPCNVQLPMLPDSSSLKWLTILLAERPRCRGSIPNRSNTRSISASSSSQGPYRSRPSQPPTQRTPGHFSQDWSDQGVKLTTHLTLETKLRINGVTSPFLMPHDVCRNNYSGRQCNTLVGAKLPLVTGC